MSILRTHNLQNPDSSSINIVMDQGGNTNITGVTTVGGSNFHVPSGSVGIGTDSLNGLLSLTAASGRILTLRNSTTGFASGDGSYLALNGSDLQIANAESANLILYTGDTERLRIASNGNTGIGTDNPGSNKLQVQGSSAFYGNGGASATWGDTSYLGALSFDGSAQPVIRAASSKALIFQVNQSTEALRITSAGKVGINEAAPDRQLHVKSGANSNDGAIRIESANNNIMDMGTDGTGHFLNCVNTDPFRIKFAGTEKLRVTSGGNIGIGTDNANHKLTLFQSGTGTFDAVNFVTGNTNSSGYQMGISAGGEVFHWNTTNSSINFATNNAEKFRITTNVGPWAEGDKGHTRGTLHLRPEATDHMGGAITFGASDSGGGHSAMAGIYTRSDGTYGTRMYFATTNSYSTGPKNAMFIDEHGYIHDSKRPYIYGSVTNTNGSGVANDMQVVSSRNLSFSNSRITVPVGGVYHICFNTITDTGTGRVDAHIRVNGSGRVSSLNDTNTNGYHYRGMSISLMLSANDYIEFNNNDWYDSTNTNFVDWRTASVVFLG